MTSAQTQQAQISAMLDAEGFGRRRVLAPILLGVMMLFNSWDSVVMAFVMPTLSHEWKLQPVSMGFLMSVGYAGQLLGALALGAAAEKLGRKPVFTAAIAVMCALSIACAMAGSYNQLAVIRFIQGLAIGGALPVCASYVNEIAPTRTRGRFFSIFQFLMISGFGAASVASTMVIEQYGWRWMFLLGVAPIVVLPFAWALLPESPRWLCRIGRFDAALAAIRRLGGGDAAPTGAAAADPSAPAKSRLTDLLAPGIRGKAGVLIALWFLTSLVSFGLTNWVPSIYVGVFHIPIREALRYSALSTILLLVTPLVLSLTMDVTGRRPLAIGGTLLGGLALLALLLVKPGQIPLVVLLTALGQAGSAVGSMILWPYSAEVFPTRVRSLALGVCSSAARTASMLTPLLVGGLLAYAGSVQPVFTLFGVIGILVATLWWRATRETAGTRIDDAAA